jgi:hypothetical protein
MDGCVPPCGCWDLNFKPSKEQSGTLTHGAISPALFFVLFCFLFCFVLFFQDRVSLYSPGCPGTHFEDQADLELRNPPASASQVLGLKACTTTAG